MNSKHLAVAAALLFLVGAAGGTAIAQTPPPAPTMAAPGAAPAAAPAATTPTPPPAPVTTPSANSGAPKSNPYGLASMWTNGDLVLKTVLVLLGIMSAGTWYIFFMKFWEQSRMISQARLVDRRFWSS